MWGEGWGERYVSAVLMLSDGDFTDVCMGVDAGKMTGV